MEASTLKTVRNMLNAGFSIKDVASETGLSEWKIVELIPKGRRVLAPEPGRIVERRPSGRFVAVTV